ncbi:MAG: hypothetical protein ACJ8F7_08110 [Gemmataceae bacterium]
MADQSKPRKKKDNREPHTSPYGPQRQVDVAAGGADSSPFENMSSEERHAAISDNEKPAEERK